MLFTSSAPRRVLVLFLVLVSSACAKDPPELELEETQIGLRKGLGGVNGDSDYCNNPNALCGPMEGDCDSNAQCEPGLVCGKDNGPRFGAPADFDFCWAPHCQNRIQDSNELGVDCGNECGPCAVCPGNNGDSNFCTPTCPCGHGEGDCDSDADCDPGTICGTNNGGLFGAPADYDYCVTAPGYDAGVPDLGVPDSGVPADAGFPPDSGVPATIVRVSVNPNGVELDFGGFGPHYSADGRYVAYSSGATNMGFLDNNSAVDVFVYDRNTQAIDGVSVDSMGADSDGRSDGCGISSDGRYVAMVSSATNLVPDDTNGVQDIFVHDRLTGATTRESVSSSGTQGTSDSYCSGIEQLSDDGRYLAFISASRTHTPGQWNGHAQAFVRDRQTAQTEVVSLSWNGNLANGDSVWAVDISPDGRYVAFQTRASNLVPAGDTNLVYDLYVRDRLNATTFRLSVAAGGGDANAQSYGGVSFSADGRYIAFSSAASNLVAGDTNGAIDIFVYDQQTATMTRASVSTTGQEGNRNSFSPSLSADGRYVSFSSLSQNFSFGDRNNRDDVFRHDMQTGETIILTEKSTGSMNLVAPNSISADGRFIAFENTATDLVPFDTNNRRDIFVADTALAVQPTSTIVCLNTDATGAPANGTSSGARIAANGRVVAFTTSATNLAPGADTNNVTDVIVRDFDSGTTERASVSSAGVQGNGNSVASGISDDGRFVSFNSLSTNLVAGDTNLRRDVFVRDRLTQETIRASVDSAGMQGNLESTGTISRDGQFVLFGSASTNFVAGDTNQVADVFVRELATGVTTRESVGTNNLQANGASYPLEIYGGGRYVVFLSSAANLGSANNRDVVLLRDRQLNTTTTLGLAGDTGVRDIDNASEVGSYAYRRTFYIYGTSGQAVVRGWDGSNANGRSRTPRISADGEFVFIGTLAGNLIHGTNVTGLLSNPYVAYVCRYSMTECAVVSQAPDGSHANADVVVDSIARDGRFVAFSTTASNMSSTCNGGPYLAANPLAP